MIVVLLRTSLSITNLNSYHAPFVNQYGVFETPGAFFVIPAFDPGVFGYAVDLDFYVSPILVAWLAANMKHFTGRIPVAYQLSPTTKTVR